ncbi:hypothetical protein FN846DRAFT_990308 [Sphaerosporella brunnea]|uniref:Uncharacterized protein n=1 Tax=Sphaerosporella brunnea TaxID=1250544 RepID=A0A5J5EQB9_9PEZI|nr:hypothetical protein FN846DRAFT_990308 [Sphaerosporella brunnea]
MSNASDQYTCSCATCFSRVPPRRGAYEDGEAVDTCQHWVHRGCLAQWVELYKLPHPAGMLPLPFNWGHKDVPGNELADALAKAAAYDADRSLPRNDARVTTLAHAQQKAGPRKGKPGWRSTVVPRPTSTPRKKADPTAFKTRKALAARFFQLRLNKGS